MSIRETSVVIVGGGPAGYEAALVAAQLGASVTIVEQDGLGGAAVLTDCVPSKALIATADHMSDLGAAERLGVSLHDREGDQVSGAVAQAHTVNGRILALAAAQSADIQVGLERAGVTFLKGSARLVDVHLVRATTAEGETSDLRADVVLIATGASPRVMPSAVPDGERILTWQQIYDLDELPARMIVIGSGVTGAELAQAYLGLGSEVVLVSSRERVLPGEDADAATVIEDVFRKRGMEVLGRSRAAGGGAHRDRGRGDPRRRAHRRRHPRPARGRLGAQHADLGLEEVGVELTESGPRAGRPGLAHQRHRCLRRRRLYRRAAAGLGGRHAGTDRDVARPR